MRKFLITAPALLLVAGCAINRQASRSRTIGPLEQFDGRVKEYVELHRRLQSKVPELKEKTEPAKILAHEQALGRLIKASRPDARQGDLFKPAVQPYFERVLKSEFTGAGGKSAKATVKDGNPRYDEQSAHPGLKVAVNATYPKSAPLSTVPPTLLFKLPKLPQELEYRFVGRNLVLLDTEANLIVDYLPEVVPQ